MTGTGSEGAIFRHAVQARIEYKVLNGLVKIMTNK